MYDSQEVFFCLLSLEFRRFFVVTVKEVASLHCWLCLLFYQALILFFH